MEGSAKRRLSASQNQKKSDVSYFNQLVEPAYSTDEEQNAQYQSKGSANKSSNKCLNLSCKTNQKNQKSEI